MNPEFCHFKGFKFHWDRIVSIDWLDTQAEGIGSIIFMVRDRGNPDLCTLHTEVGRKIEFENLRSRLKVELEERVYRNLPANVLQACLALPPDEEDSCKSHKSHT